MEHDCENGEDERQDCGMRKYVNYRLNIYINPDKLIHASCKCYQILFCYVVCQ